MTIRRLEGKESGIEKRRKSADLLQFQPLPLGQCCPKHCPPQTGPNPGQPAPSGADSRLGPPLDIKQVARLIGCSPWTVRQKLIPRGLPHFRSGASSKLIFFTNQIVRWIEHQQGGQRM